MSVNLNTDFHVGEGNLTLTIVIGDKQFGTSTVKLDGQILLMGDVQDFLIGPGPDLIGKTLFVKTMVSDQNDATNRTSVTYTFHDGANEQKYGLDATVGEDGASITYRATFRFVA